MAVAGASVGLLSAVIAILVVPSLLALLGTRIDALSIRRGPAVSDESDGWYRLARWVMRHPVGVALASAAPAAGRRGAAALDDADRPRAPKPCPRDKPSYEANSYVEAPLPARRHRGGHGHRRRPRRAAPSWPRFRPRGSRRSTASPAAPPSSAPPASVAYANFALAGPAVSEESQDTVQRIRDLAPPAATAALVSGNTARFIDQKQSLADHLPLLVAIICRHHLVLLFLLTGSVILPLKTLLMNAMTLGAVPRDRRPRLPGGWLDGLFDYTRPGRGRGDEPGLPLRGRSSASRPTTRCW